MKKKILLTAVVASLMTLFACEEISTVEDAAKKASEEMCDCIKNNTRSECEKKLNSNYSSYINNDEFYTKFNNINDCGITIRKETK